MAGTAELGTRLAATPEQLVYAVPEMPADAEQCRRAAAFIGAVATSAWNQEEAATQEALDTEPIESLYDGLIAFQNGDERGRKMVEINAGTDLVERVLKSGHITEVRQSVRGGKVQQNGQSDESIQANSLRFAADTPQMRRRTEAETRNMFRKRHYFDQGTLEDYYLLVSSPAADDMTIDEMRCAGFFTDTMSASLQLTSASGNELITESAFVAGAKAPGERRHDRETLVKMYAYFGVDIRGMSATELLDTPLLIHKSLLPHGAASLVELYDDAAGGTFFGEDKPREDYVDHRRRCAEREAAFKPTVDNIVDELIDRTPEIDSPVTAVKVLDKVSAKHAIRLAARDKSINPDVFGATASGMIEVARWHLALGNHAQAAEQLEEALFYETSSSCPSARKNEAAEGRAKSGDTATETEDCEFTSKECPMCHKKDVRTTVRRVGGKKLISGNCGCWKFA